MRALVLGLVLLAAGDQLVYAGCSTDAECQAVEAQVSFSWLRSEALFCKALVDSWLPLGPDDGEEYTHCNILVMGILGS